MVCVGVIIEGLVNSIDKQYDYELPPELEQSIKVGCRVVIPFGNSNRKMQALVVSITKTENTKLKKIISQLDNEPIISKELLETVFFIKERTFCNFFDAFSTVVPAGIRLKLKTTYQIIDNTKLHNLTDLGEKVYNVIKEKGLCDLTYLNKKVGINCKNEVDYLLLNNYIIGKTDTFKNVNDLMIKSAHLIVSKEEAEDYCNSLKNSIKHQKIIDLLISSDSVPVSELCYLAGVSTSVIVTLEKRGIVEIYEQEIYRAPYYNNNSCDNLGDIELSKKQQQVFDKLGNKLDIIKPSISLLYGVTGSGKTLVYLKLIDKALSLNKDTIVLVPEISLTPQLTNKMFERYGKKIAVLHSGLSLGERFDEYKRIKSGEAKIAIGTRSCIFAPFENIGLIIIDEEQEHTYKSENTPRYNAKDVAKFRTAYNNALLLLCSATPSVESFSLAKSGKYDLLKLDERYGKAELPEVIICDMKEELELNKSVLSERLSREIEINLENKEQTVLFLNRRGYNSILSCRSCGYVFNCTDCSVAMTYHIKNNSLMCHYCGKYSDKPEKCPQCGSEHIKHFGIGTQKIEEFLKEKFPDANIERMDMDTTGSKNSHDKIIKRLINGDIDILIGTQMVTKGIDIPNVTLVGVLLADGLLYADDFRANERAFSLLTQVEGRAGRADKKGRAIIQTYTPNNRIIELAKNQDYEGFYREEIAYRKSVILPPYCDILFINFSDENIDICKDSSEFCFEYLIQNAKDIKNFIIYPPLPSPLGRMNKKFRFRIMIKCINDKRVRQLVNTMVQEFYKQKIYKTTSLYCDINSYSAI